jgi:hypothetical protein
MSVASIYLDSTPGEEFLKEHLQKRLSLVLGRKNIKTGKLMIYRRTHYFLQLTLQNSRNNIENIEIPFPFNTEHYPNENVIYFDYRIKSLTTNDQFLLKALTDYRIKNITPSQYFDKILEITVLD